jgi:hypothetical protein
LLSGLLLFPSILKITQLFKTSIPFHPQTTGVGGRYSFRARRRNYSKGLKIDLK